MKYCIIFPLMVALLKFSTAYAQVSEGFDDGNFNLNPKWIGDTTSFIINEDKMLQLNADPEQGVASLFTTNTSFKDATWFIDVQMQFNPSSNNYCDIFIASNTPEYSDNLYGYFIRVGNKDDEISFYRKNGPDETELIDGIDDVLDQNSNNVSIKITHSSNTWHLYYSTNNQTDWIEIGSVDDNTFTGSSYCGFTCKYTSSRSTKFFFDNIKIIGDSGETQSNPYISSIKSSSMNSLNISFSQPIANISFLTIDDFIITPELSMSSITVNNDSSIIATFDQDLVDETYYMLSVNFITDYTLVSAHTVSKEFQFAKPYIAQEGDIILTEIMADPAPSVGLPEFEYLEITNRSNKTLENQILTFAIGTHSFQTTALTLKPKEVIIIADSQTKDTFADYGEVEAVTLPAISNSGSSICLINSNEDTLQTISYTTNWYRDSDKSEGGYALELIDLNSVCYSKAENWIASFDDIGGSPGELNKAELEISDSTPPNIQEAKNLSADSVLIIFNETLTVLPNIHFIPDTNIDTLFFPDAYSDSLWVLLSDTLPSNSRYQIIVSNTTDCFSNPLTSDTTELIIPSNEHDGILFSEVLFNASNDAPEFVELYNFSDAYIDVTDWTLNSYQDSTEKAQVKLPTSLSIFPPNSYYVLTQSKSELINAFPSADEHHILEVNLPTLNDDNGYLDIVDSENNIIETMYYSEDWHHQRIKDVNGVSLERISWDIDATSSDNWMSAAETENYATPTEPNSQHSEMSTLEGTVNITPKSISPDQDGYRDYMEISYNLPRGGLEIQAEIYSLNGQLIASLANDMIVGDFGQITWEGTNDDGTIAAPGNYILFLEISENGKPLLTKREKIVIFYP